MIVEVNIRNSRMFEVKGAMQPLSILHAQPVPFLRDLLAVLAEAFLLTGSIALLRPSLVLRPRLCRALALRRIAILLTLAFGAPPVFT
jgi:hypothetical protein